MAKQKVIDKKKQKQQDAVIKNAVDDFDKFEDFVSVNLKNIIISFVIIAVLLVIGSVAYILIEKENMRVSAELTDAETVEELKAAIAKFKDNDSVYPAKLRLATLYFNQGKYEEAQSVYISLAVDAPAGEVRNRARLNQAYTLEALNKPIEAADKFAVIGEDRNKVPEYIRDEANFAAGRIYIAQNKPEKAKACLKLIDFKKAGFFAAQGEKLFQRIN